MTCSQGDNVTEIISADHFEPTAFENQLNAEFVGALNIVQFVANTTNHLEYFLNLGIVGQDVNGTREMATVDNEAIFVSPNVTLQGPRRFFRIGIAPAIPWSYIKIDDKTGEPSRDIDGNVIWEGYCIDFAAKMAETLDFDYVLVPTKNGLFGDRVPHMNNTWDGLVGDLMVGVSFDSHWYGACDHESIWNLFFKDIDIAVAPMKMTAEREEVIDFVAPYYEQTGILIGTFHLNA